MIQINPLMLYQLIIGYFATVIAIGIQKLIQRLCFNLVNYFHCLYFLKQYNHMNFFTSIG